MQIENPASSPEKEDAVKSFVPPKAPKPPVPDYDIGEEVPRTIHNGKKTETITLRVRDRQLRNNRKWYYQMERNGKPYVENGTDWFSSEDI